MLDMCFNFGCDFDGSPFLVAIVAVWGPPQGRVDLAECRDCGRSRSVAGSRVVEAVRESA